MRYKRKGGLFGYSLAMVGCWVFVIAINLVIGSWSVNYLLAFFGKSIPFIAAALIGLIGGEVTIPLAIVAAILHAVGVF